MLMYCIDVWIFLCMLSKIGRNFSMSFNLSSNIFSNKIDLILPDNLIVVEVMLCRVQPDPTSEIHSSFCHLLFFRVTRGLGVNFFRSQFFSHNHFNQHHKKRLLTCNTIYRCNKTLTIRYDAIFWLKWNYYRSYKLVDD